MTEYITIIGHGSLICEAWARESCPDLKNHRLIKLDGYKRIFNKVNPFCIRIGRSNKDCSKNAALSAIPDDTIKGMIACAFEIPLTQWPWFVRREFEYRLVSVPFTDHDTETRMGVLCMGDYKNDAECEIVVNADPLRLKLWQEFKANYEGPMWRNDLLPEQRYLERCLEAVKSHGQEVYDNFIDLTFTGDGRTVREYLG